MEIKYYWARKGDDPKEITSVTIATQGACAIPRIGELVDLEFKINDGEWAVKHGRVEDVSWKVTAPMNTVAIRLR